MWRKCVFAPMFAPVNHIIKCICRLADNGYIVHYTVNQCALLLHGTAHRQAVAKILR